MPPAKVRIERIKDERTRQNTYHKRKGGLIKKAMELSLMCECEIMLIMKSAPTKNCRDGQLTSYCSKDLTQMLRETLFNMPKGVFGNEDYTRFSKDGEAVAVEPGELPPHTPPTSVEGMPDMIARLKALETRFQEQARDKLKLDMMAKQTATDHDNLRQMLSNLSSSTTPALHAAEHGAAPAASGADVPVAEAGNDSSAACVAAAPASTLSASPASTLSAAPASTLANPDRAIADARDGHVAGLVTTDEEAAAQSQPAASAANLNGARGPGARQSPGKRVGPEGEGGEGGEAKKRARGGARSRETAAEARAGEAEERAREEERMAREEEERARREEESMAREAAEAAAVAVAVEVLGKAAAARQRTLAA